MLLEISIRHFAIIENISLHFDNGMTVLTGETGAGKSIIIDAMNMMLGARANSDAVRHGAQKAEIEGLFDISHKASLKQLLVENGIDSSGELIIRREIHSNGRSVSRINGQMVNLSVLKEVGQQLVDIHGQHDQEELMKPSQHIVMLDQFGSKEFQEIKKNYQNLFDDYKELRKRVLLQKKNENDNKARIEMLAYQISEIESADLKTNEDELLQEERHRIMNHKKIADALAETYHQLDDDEFSSLSHIRSAMNEIDSIESYDSRYQEISKDIQESYYVLEDVTKRLSDIIDDLDYDPNRLLSIDSRLDVINTITRKYGGTVNDVLDYLINIQKEYQLLTVGDETMDDSEARLKKLEQSLLSAVKTLSQKRHDIAKTLEKNIKQELKDLYMEKAEFKVVFSESKFNRLGNENVTFYISTNPGESFKPLIKVASGGELSRLMLAIKTVFSKSLERTSIVFDEVDTGVSGRVAQAIAEKIHLISQHGQVLAISHLPQVIAKADHQFFIEKTSDNTSTVSTVRLLNTDERIEEIAKMLAGNDVTDTARAQAKELLNKK
ncbi:DNA repair protein RecN [Streptococcus pacificus]|uniref:DNA repair protein RecN n=1 Tax=Streptococcus pacificus TaxID=2740577 RepID=A0ABS0ZJF0_9STRE|nr:DNA repair protein RecN [Streptococcus pacificus]MBJ8325993.1 DNA repair protein RecN [Streptococcus pacificus]